MTANSKMMGDDGFNPAAHAAAVAFGFVYVHPFEDGNGRVHRYLLQHVLAARKVSPTGMVFPVATVILDRIEDYAAVLKRHSLPLMEYIPWKQAANGNVEIFADTADYYRYPDVTEQATFLAECIERTVDHDMPAEINYLKGFDRSDKGTRYHRLDATAYGDLAYPLDPAERRNALQEEAKGRVWQFGR